MEKADKNSNIYKARITLTTGGDYGYTFRVMPKHEMILESQNLNLVKWITDEMQKDEEPKEEQEGKSNQQEEIIEENTNEQKIEEEEKPEKIIEENTEEDNKENEIIA